MQKLRLLQMLLLATTGKKEFMQKSKAADKESSSTTIELEHTLRSISRVDNYLLLNLERVHCHHQMFLWEL